MDTPVTDVSKPTVAKSSRRWILWGSAIALLGIGIWYLAFVNPLPSDEELIAHFQRHRGEVEQLVEHFREYRQPKNVVTEWDKLPKIEGLMKQAGIRRVVEGGAWWLPDPYSAETAPKLMELIKAGGSFEQFRRYRSIALKMTDLRYFRPAIIHYWFSAAIWKDIYFFPQPPKIDQERIWFPVGIDGQLKESYRVYSSLNGYPSDWRRGECVYRKLEPQWFIIMCRAA